MTDKEKMNKNKLLIIPVILILLTTAFSGCFGVSTRYHYYGVESVTFFHGGVNNTRHNYQKLLKGVNDTNYQISSRYNMSDFEEQLVIGIPPNTTKLELSFNNISIVNLGLKGEQIDNNITTQIFITEKNITVFGLYRHDLVSIDKNSYDEKIPDHFKNDKTKLEMYINEIYGLVENIYDIEKKDSYYRLMVEGPFHAD